MDSPRSTPSTPSLAVGKTTPCPTHTHTPPPGYSPTPLSWAQNFLLQQLQPRLEPIQTKAEVRSLNANPVFPDCRGITLFLSTRGNTVRHFQGAGASDKNIYQHFCIIKRRNLEYKYGTEDKKKTFQDKQGEVCFFLVLWQNTVQQTDFFFFSHYR